MKSSSVFNAFLKSTRIRKRTMVNACNSRKTIVKNNLCAARSTTLTEMCFRQKYTFPIIQQLRIFNSTDVSQRKDESDSDIEDPSYELDSDIDDASQELRRFLYPDSQDYIILKFRDCASIQAVYDVISEHEHELDGRHASQAILVLWDLQKIYYKMNKESFKESCDSLSIPLTQIMEEFNEKVVSHSKFCKIVNLLERHVNELSPDATACIFLFLKRMGVSLDTSVMQSLLLNAEALLENENITFPMSALARLTDALKELDNLTFVFSVQKALPCIYKNIGNCDSEDEIQLLSTCLYNVRSLISPTTLNTFKYRVENLIETGVLSSFQSSVIIKIASVFSQPFRNFKHRHLTRKLLLLLKGKTSNLQKSDVIRAHKIMEYSLEPADLYAELAERASQLLSEEESLSSVENGSIDLLACMASFCPPKKRKALEDITCNYLKQQITPVTLAFLFKILRYLKTSNTELCDEFWSRSLDVIRSYPSEYSCYNIGKYSNRYMFFNNNLSGSFRHYEFEKQLIEWYLHLYKTGILGFIPSEFAQMIGFFVAYGDRQNNDFFKELEFMITKLEEMSFQLNPADCSNISRGIQISNQLRSRIYDRPHMFTISVKLNSILNTCAIKHLEILNYNLPFTNLLMKSYVIRKSPSRTDISQNLVERYEKSIGPVDSKSLNAAVHNFMESRCLIPKTIDQLAMYVEENAEYMLGKTVELFLFLCLTLGYSPSNANSFFKVASGVIVRESDNMSGLSVLMSSLALCFFHSLPKALVNFIFTIDFLEKLDQEIANCYAKATYPARIRNYLMQVNRAVCLDYPEFDVPWFHKKYCEEIAAKDEIQSSVFYNEVKEILVDILGEKNFARQHSYSSYGYKLDFELFFNEKNVPVSWKRRSDKNILRKAVMLLREDMFSNNVRLLNGFIQMKKRHLEMLGYDVILVEQTVWNSMYMSEPQMKHNFMKERLFKNDNKVLRNVL